MRISMGPPPARAGDLPFHSRTTTPSSLGGSRACAVVTALPLCRWPKPSGERLEDKGAQEGSCFRARAPQRAGNPDPFPLVPWNLLSKSASSLPKTTKSRVAGVLGSLCAVLAPPHRLLSPPQTPGFGAS